MPGFLNNPSSIISQIKSNLQDRYGSGYPILKELLQNADDAEANRFRLDALPGWPDAINPLLRGPGLLVANDGFFRKQDETGIMSFGESSKVDDNSAIGKFGFGQKAVFHLCDAFIVHARRENGETFSTVINPFLDVVADNNISWQWELPAGGLDPVDVGFMTSKIASDFPKRRLVLWLPLRREEIQPAPNVAFSSNIPSAEETIRELLRPDELRVLLTALRHLTSIEIMEGGRLHCAFELNAMRGRFVGPDLNVPVQPFGGEIGATGMPTAPFVGREAKAPDGRLAALKLTQHWPKSITALSPRPVPEKGEPHGAATLLRIPQTGLEKTAPGHLRISWAVFLPISDESDVVIPIESGGISKLNLLLHGYFFLDSGRRHIEGLNASVETGEPTDASALRRAWNGELRDSVVLPLLPLLLKDALGRVMKTSDELTHLVSALARHEWFRRNREAICREHALVRVLEASGGPVWRVVSSMDTLRPLPVSFADTPQRVGDLFGDIRGWAEANEVRLVVDSGAALSVRPIRWTAADLSTIFTGLSPRAFQSREFARLLVDFLGMAGLGDAERSAIGPHMVAALRKAMMETNAFAPSEFIKSALAHLPHGALFPLPPSVENRDVLRAERVNDNETAGSTI
jgi:hypothetical protein